LEVTVRTGQIEVGDRTVGALGVYPRGKNNDYDYEALSKKLSELKARYPEKTEVSVLLESDIPYDTLVQVMDRVRVAESIVEDKIVRDDLFPDISIGDAPVLDGGA
jgi:hypothetical protein